MTLVVAMPCLRATFVWWINTGGAWSYCLLDAETPCRSESRLLERNGDGWLNGEFLSSKTKTPGGHCWGGGTQPKDVFCKLWKVWVADSFRQNQGSCEWCQPFGSGSAIGPLVGNGSFMKGRIDSNYCDTEVKCALDRFNNDKFLFLTYMIIWYILIIDVWSYFCIFQHGILVSRSATAHLQHEVTQGLPKLHHPFCKPMPWWTIGTNWWWTHQLWCNPLNRVIWTLGCIKTTNLGQMCFLQVHYAWGNSCTTTPPLYGSIFLSCSPPAKSVKERNHGILHT